jgi:capsular polysaccharide biosynthesis protein
MNEQPLDLRASLSALRRRRVAIAIVGFIGMCLGLFNVASHRAMPTAVALVVVPGQSGATGDISTIVQSQAQVASGSLLRDAALKSLTPPVRPDQVGVTVAANDTVLRIRAHAPQAKQATALANGVASGYIQWVTAHKPPGVGSPTVIQPAAITPPASFTSRAVKNGAIGLAAGLLLAIIIVLVRAKRDHRLRRRDQIARAIGVPVLAAIQSGQYKSVAQWRSLLEHFQPSPSTAWNLRKVLRHLVPGDLEADVNVCVAAFAADTAALAVGPQLALVATGFGLPTDLDPGDQKELVPLRAACAILSEPSSRGRILEFGPRDEDPWKRVWDTPDRRVAKGAQLEVSMVALERSRPELSPFIGRLILAVSAGFPLTDDLAGVALAATEHDLKIDGIVLVNPEPGDATVGMIPDRDEELFGGDYPNSRPHSQPSDGATAVGRAG